MNKATREARERLVSELQTTEEQIGGITTVLERSLKQGLAWAHPNLIGHRARLGKLLVDRVALRHLLKTLTPPAEPSVVDETSDASTESPANA